MFPWHIFVDRCLRVPPYTGAVVGSASLHFENTNEEDLLCFLSNIIVSHAKPEMLERLMVGY